jgi:hypothetical protein
MSSLFILPSVRHPRESGDPASFTLGLRKLGSRFRGNDGKRGGSAHEVGDVGADGFLSDEFEIVQLAVAEVVPEFGFGLGGFSAEFVGAGQGFGVFTHEHKAKAPHPPIARAMGPNPLPVGERE